MIFCFSFWESTFYNKLLFCSYCRLSVCFHKKFAYKFKSGSYCPYRRSGSCPRLSYFMLHQNHQHGAPQWIFALGPACISYIPFLSFPLHLSAWIAEQRNGSAAKIDVVEWILFVSILSIRCSTHIRQSVCTIFVFPSASPVLHIELSLHFGQIEWKHDCDSELYSYISIQNIIFKFRHDNKAKSAQSNERSTLDTNGESLDVISMRKFIDKSQRTFFVASKWKSNRLRLTAAFSLLTKTRIYEFVGGRASYTKLNLW